MLRYFPIAGRLIMTDDTDSAHVIFDTDEPFLCVKPQDFVAGSVVVPARTATSSGVDGNQTVVDIERTYLLATIDIPGAKVVRGMMRSTWSSNPEPGHAIWRQATGTHLDILDGVNSTQVPQSDTGGYARVATMGGYTFEVNGLNQLVMRERIVMRARDPGGPPTTFNRARSQATIQFRLLVGFFLDQDFTPRPIGDFVHSDGRSIADPANAQSFGGCNFGFPFAGRRLVAFVHRGNQSSTGATSVTIGGVAAGNHGQVAIGGQFVTQVWSAVVPSGASGTVTITNSSGWPGGTIVLDLALELYAVGGTVGGPVITSGTSAGTTASCNVNVTDGHIALVASHYTGVGGVRWVNVNEKNLMLTTERSASGIVLPGEGSLTAQAIWASGAKGIIAARFSM